MDVVDVADVIRLSRNTFAQSWIFQNVKKDIDLYFKYVKLSE